MTVDEQLNLLKRSAAEIISEDDLRAKLEKSRKKGIPLKVKLGLDPTAPDIHLGIAVVLRKLRQFQDIGHQVIIIIGDFTAMIGDPSGKSEIRKQLSPEEIAVNAKTYAEQYTKILDPEKTQVVFNSQWLGVLNFADVISLCAKTTVARVLERDDFQKRLSENRALGVHEILYPICQAYDSAQLEADIEMGGTDQKFNNLMGRDLQRTFGQEPQVVFLMPILVGLDGVQKMSKSLSNYIGISESSSDMFGKVMSISDEMMRDYFVLCTDIPLTEIDSILTGHPMVAKERLANEIISLYHSKQEAEKAQEEFERVHSQQMHPERIPTFKIPSEELSDGKIWIVRLLKLSGLASSSNEARRLISQDGISLDSQKIKDVDTHLFVKNGSILQVGRRRFVHLHTEFD